MQSYRKLQLRTSIYETVPAPGTGIRLGIYQAQAACGEGATLKNMARLERAVAQAKKFQVQLLSFPELYVPGYTLSPETAKKVAETRDGPSITKGCAIAKKNHMALLLPYAEKAARPDGTFQYYDSIAIINENGELLDSYRKTQLYGQQERDNWSFGTGDYKIHRLFGFPVGVLNCYECEFPELSRILALKGAKLIVGPTAADNYYTLPGGKRSSVPYPDISKLLIPAYAYANNVFFAYANRAGYEHRGEDQWHYRGNSIVCGPHGDVMVAANHEQDTLLVADCVPAYYGATHPAPAYYYLKDRRPRSYGELVAPTADFIKGGYSYPLYENGREVPAQSPKK
ncbi:MAG: carbon-nitrogen hydrolase family protein [Deltaproteobacteria bacterium]|nr:carbon-nitrogen hydrolase family protein [Deltaproteobacteria bacterium]